MTDPTTQGVVPCLHAQIATWSNPEYPDASMWSCADCGIRFYPHDAAERSASGSRALEAETRLALAQRVVDAARDVDALWEAEDGELICWEVEAGEALNDLRVALAALDTEAHDAE